MPTPHERKRPHESEYNSHESEMVPTSGGSKGRHFGVTKRSSSDKNAPFLVPIEVEAKEKTLSLN